MCVCVCVCYLYSCICFYVCILILLLYLQSLMPRYNAHFIPVKMCGTSHCVSGLPLPHDTDFQAAVEGTAPAHVFTLTHLKRGWCDCARAGDCVRKAGPTRGSSVVEEQIGIVNPDVLMLRIIFIIVSYVCWSFKMQCAYTSVRYSWCSPRIVFTRFIFRKYATS